MSIQAPAITGPWVARANGVWQHHRDGDYCVADCADEAIARLISAAPELLDIAQTLLDEIKTDRESTYQCITVGGVEATADAEDLAMVHEMDRLISRTQSIIDKAQGQ